MGNHDRGGSHDHAGHSHSHGPSNFNMAFAVGISLNILFVLVEAGYGFISNSLALMADAGHNLGDVAGLALAWGAAWLSMRRPTRRFTYGLRSSSILAALANALLLLVATAGIIWEAIARLRHPAPVSGSTVIIVASIGIVINAFTAFLFMSGRKGDLNIRGAYLHMAADAVVSIGVVVAGIIIAYTNWAWLDPSVSLVIALVIVFGTWELLRDSVRLAVAAVPSGINTEEVLSALSELPGVGTVHDLHVWAMSTTETALTAHLVVPSGHPGDAFLLSASETLRTRFNIQHSTIQIELGDSPQGCELEPDEVV